MKRIEVVRIDPIPNRRGRYPVETLVRYVPWRPWLMEKIAGLFCRSGWNWAVDWHIRSEVACYNAEKEER